MQCREHLHSHVLLMPTFSDLQKTYHCAWSGMPSASCHLCDQRQILSWHRDLTGWGAQGLRQCSKWCSHTCISLGSCSLETFECSGPNAELQDCGAVNQLSLENGFAEVNSNFPDTAYTISSKCMNRARQSIDYHLLLIWKFGNQYLETHIQ